jgi:hypothetical protein
VCHTSVIAGYGIALRRLSDLRSRLQKGVLRVARYFFNVIDGKFIVDDVGVELPDIAAIRSMAIRTAGAILRDEGTRLAVGADWQMYVTNEAKETVFKLRFSAEAIAPTAEPVLVAGKEPVLPPIRVV